MYKFKNEENVPTELWEASRNFILDTLRNKKTNSTRLYLNVFNEWKSKEFDTFFDEVFEYYIYAQKMDHTELIEQIRDIAQKMGFLEKIDKKMNELTTTIVKDVMHQAYWDMLEEDIRKKEYSTVICQLTELFNIMKEIVPERFHSDLYDKFDVDYVHQLINSDTLYKEYISDLCHWIILTLKEWDSASNQPFYDKEIKTYENTELELPTFIRFSLELCTLLATDAKIRISLWRTLKFN